MNDSTIKDRIVGIIRHFKVKPHERAEVRAEVAKTQPVTTSDGTPARKVITLRKKTINDNTLKGRIASIVQQLNAGLHEREEVVAVSLLAALAGQNTFLLGPPGTAKSLIARRLSYAFSDSTSYFEYLMQRFSTPEDIFGPISIAELKKDHYTRKTEGFLPTANFAFLDEIWKAGPAILNSLLTIINEKTFRNGTKVKKVPLKALIAASNETPPDKQGLDALYDRFLVRLHVPPMEDRDHFQSLLKSVPADATVSIVETLAIKNEELDEWSKKIQEVQISQESINIVNLIKSELSKKKKTHPDVYISDRRWQRAMILIKAAAFFCDRKETNLVDTLLLRHCLWSNENDRQKLIGLIESAVRDSGFSTEISDDSLHDRKNKLHSDIENQLFHTDNIYESVYFGKTPNDKYLENTVTLHEYHYSRGTKITYYIPYSAIGGKGEHHPTDRSGNDIKSISYCFNGSSTYTLESKERYNGFVIDDERHEGSIKISPKISSRKGARRKEDGIERIASSIRNEVNELSENFKTTLREVEMKHKSFLAEVETVFVPNDIRDVALESVEEQEQNLEKGIKDCDQFLKKIGD